jgi:hypothetical protein
VNLLPRQEIQEAARRATEAEHVRWEESDANGDGEDGNGQFDEGFEEEYEQWRVSKAAEVERKRQEAIKRASKLRTSGVKKQMTLGWL